MDWCGRPGGERLMPDAFRVSKVFYAAVAPVLGAFFSICCGEFGRGWPFATFAATQRYVRS